MGKLQKVILQLSFPNEEKAEEFVYSCLNSINSVYSLNRNEIYVVLQSQEDRTAALLEAEKLNGRLREDDE